MHSFTLVLCSLGSKYAISGGSDEQCKIFDLDKRVEHGALTHHEGTVSCVATHGPTSHLLTASDDNSISVVRMGSWQVEKTLYKHSAGVTALALHPTGKLAFSAAKDKKMITWNLVKARPAFISHIKVNLTYSISSNILSLIFVCPGYCGDDSCVARRNTICCWTSSEGRHLQH